MTRSIIITAALAATAGTAFAGDSIFAESFEAAPGTGYTLSNEFDDGGFDFFGRYMVPDTTNGARDDFESGFDGSWAIFGQDHDGDGFDVTQTVTMAAIDIAGFTDLSMTASFGALNSEPDFTNYEVGDGFRIFATIDGGTRALIGEFAPDTNGASDLYLDTDGDGVGDGDRLTTDLADFSFDISSTGALLTLEIEFSSNSGFEPLALDNVRVTGVPTPGAVALLGMGGMIATRRRRA